MDSSFWDGSRRKLDLPIIPAQPANVLLQGPRLLDASAVKPKPKHKPFPFPDDPVRQKEFEEMLKPRDSGPGYLLDSQWRNQMSGAFNPAYNFLESFSDRVYDLLNFTLISRILPERLGNELHGSPDKGSYDDFNREFYTHQRRFLERLHDTFPMAAYQSHEFGNSNYQQVDEWRSWAVHEQVSLLIDSYQKTMVKHYGLDIFGDKAQKYARNRANWDPYFLALGALVGGTFLWFNGLHTSLHLWDWRLGMDLTAARRMVNVLQNEGSMNRAAGFELGRKDSPWAGTLDLNLKDARPENTRYGLKYRIRFGRGGCRRLEDGKTVGDCRDSYTAPQ